MTEDEPVTQAEIDDEENHRGSVAYDFRTVGSPGFIFHDEPRREAQEARAPKEDSVAVYQREIDKSEIQAAAIRFINSIMLLSRTNKAAKLRLLAAQYISTGSPAVWQIAKRMRVSHRQVYRAINVVKRHCGIK